MDRETFDCIREPIESVVARKKGNRDKTKGLGWNLYRREGRGNRGSSGGGGRGAGATESRTRVGSWKKDLD